MRAIGRNSGAYCACDYLVALLAYKNPDYVCEEMIAVWVEYITPFLGLSWRVILELTRPTNRYTFIKRK